MVTMDEDDCSVSKPIEHALSTPSIVSGSTNMGPLLMRDEKIDQKLGIISFN